MNQIILGIENNHQKNTKSSQNQLIKLDVHRLQSDHNNFEHFQQSRGNIPHIESGQRDVINPNSLSIGQRGWQDASKRQQSVDR